MAVWLRAIVVSLLHRRELDEALKYIENAAHFIGQPRVRRACFPVNFRPLTPSLRYRQSTYPSEEADWCVLKA